MTRAEEPSGGPQSQRSDADPDEATDVIGDLSSIPDLLHHGVRGDLQVGKRGVVRAGDGRLAGDQIPARLLVAAGQRGRQNLRERLVGLERRQEQRAH